MIHRKLLPAAVALLLVLTGLSAAAQSTFSSRIDECRAIAEREARFTCYDGVEAQATAAAPAIPASAAPAPESSASTPAVAPPAAAPEVAAPAPTPAPAQSLDDFGKTVTARLEQDEAGQVELVDRVAGLKEVQFKQWQITLESGQVWRQQLSQTFNLKAGYEVRITPISGGPNHRLSSPQLAGAIQVRRVR